MPASWAGQYIGLPFLENGRTRAGADCYGLLRIIYKEQLGIDLPAYNEGYKTSTDGEEIGRLVRGEMISQWKQVIPGEARPFDVVVFRILGHPMHVGLVVEAPRFIHAWKGCETAIERWDSITWRNRLHGIVRWASIQAG